MASETGTEEKLLQTAAWAEFEKGLQQYVTFAQACEFWGINDGLSASEIDARIDALSLVLARENLNRLTQLHVYLQQRFFRHLALLRRSARHGQ